MYKLTRWKLLNTVNHWTPKVDQLANRKGLLKAINTNRLTDSLSILEIREAAKLAEVERYGPLHHERKLSLFRDDL